MKRLILTSLLTLTMCGASFAEECTPEQAEDMTSDVMEEAVKAIQRYLINTRQLKLEKDKVGYVLVARRQEMPEKLKPLVADINRLADLVKQKSPQACDESERLRQKYKF